MVREMPTLSSKEQPTIAVITSLYCEKLAVDAMMDDRVTYVKYRTEGTAPNRTVDQIRHRVYV